MTTLKYLNTEACNFEACHPVWNCQNTDSISVSKANVHAKVLVQRYPLLGGTSRRHGASITCPVCFKDKETLQHFLLSCPAYDQHRLSMLARANTVIMTNDGSKSSNLLQMSSEQLVSTILDSSHVDDLDDTSQQALNEVMKDYCFKIHHLRSVLLHGESRYVVATKRHLKTRSSTRL